MDRCDVMVETATQGDCRMVCMKLTHIPTNISLEYHGRYRVTALDRLMEALEVMVELNKANKNGN